jgi:uncharacterized protein YjbJ (UPF0337 family)
MLRKRFLTEVFNMNWEEVRGNWVELKGKLRSQWGKLTDQDIEQVAGAKDRLIGVLKQRYGYEKEQASRQIDEWVGRLEAKISKEHTDSDKHRG